MQYLLLIYDNEKTAPEPSEEEMKAWFDYTEEMQTAKVFLGGEALQPSSTATSVRIREGEQLITDGPFAETKEQLGGFYLMDCKDLDEAIEWAKKCPAVDRGTIELRPVMKLD